VTSNQTRADIYRRMYRAFASDETIRKLIMAGTVSVIYYSGRGQEAIPAAVSTLLTDDDYITTNYRGIHDIIAKGASLGELFAEIFGRATGVNKAKGGLLHVVDPRVGVMANSAIVAGTVPIANGLALWSSMTESDAVTISYFGDGSTNIGAFHESLNMAAVWDLPVVFVCQNNGYGQYIPRMQTMRVEEIATRADSYGMPGVRVDGNDPDAMYEVAKAAVDRARAGQGPTLIEAMTYRFMGHNFGMDRMEYMPKDEYQAAVAADPVPAYRRRLIEEGALSEAEIAELEAQVEREVSEGIEFALASPYPDPTDVVSDVYAEVVPA
jgi:pyruvate dehydrogenase E1 component alpha subunit